MPALPSSAPLQRLKAAITTLYYVGFFILIPLRDWVEFFAGMAAAHFYLMGTSSRAPSQPSQASTVVFASVGAVVAIHLLLYGMIAPNSVTIARIASPLYGPPIAIMMYLIARYDTRCSRMFSNSVLVKLGEASYSIYLLHEILPSAYRENRPSYPGSMVCVAVVGRVVGLIGCDQSLVLPVH